MFDRKVNDPDDATELSVTVEVQARAGTLLFIELPILAHRVRVRSIPAVALIVVPSQRSPATDPPPDTVSVAFKHELARAQPALFNVVLAGNTCAPK